MTVPHTSPETTQSPARLRARVRRLDVVRESLASVEILSLRRSWSAGFGPTLDPFHANITGATEAKCRRDLVKLLGMYAHRLSLAPTSRQEFEAAIAEVKSAPAAQPWTARVVADHHDLTFWMMKDVDAIRRGVRPKR